MVHNEELPELVSCSFAHSNSAVGPLLNILYSVNSTYCEAPHYAVFNILVLIRHAVIQPVAGARSRSSMKYSPVTPQTNCPLIPDDTLRPLPSLYFLIHYSVIARQFDDKHYELLTI